MDRQCSAEELTAQAAFSRFHFQRMFRAPTGESVAGLVSGVHAVQVESDVVFEPRHFLRRWKLNDYCLSRSTG